MFQSMQLNLRSAHLICRELSTSLRCMQSLLPSSTSVLAIFELYNLQLKQMVGFLGVK